MEDNAIKWEEFNENARITSQRVSFPHTNYPLEVHVCAWRVMIIGAISVCHR